MHVSSDKENACKLELRDSTKNLSMDCQLGINCSGFTFHSLALPIADAATNGITTSLFKCRFRLCYFLRLTIRIFSLSSLSALDARDIL